MKTLLSYLLLSLLSLCTWAQCGGDVTYELSIPPGADGTYPPNTTVELCVTMTGWDGNMQGSNWLEGFGLTLGFGWAVVNPTLPPADAESDASGTWLWVETVTSDATGLTAGPGYFFEGPTGPTDGNPGNDWGDYCMNGDCVWTFCVELTTSANSGEPLNIEVQNYADGTMGSWGNNDCVGQDPPEILFNGVVGCSVYGCTDIAACNYDPNAQCDDGSCGYFSMGDITHNFMPCPDTTCIGSEISYSVTGDISSTYDWFINAGGLVTSDQTNDCEIVWGDIPGTYTIYVREMTADGCVGDIRTCDVEVLIPDIVFSPSKVEMCLNSSMDISASPAGGIWSSDFMNSSIFVATQAGTFYPSYTTNMYGCDVQEEVQVTVKRKYDAPNIIYSSEIIDLCFDSNYQIYIADDSVGVDYSWFIDDVRQLSTQNVLEVEWYDTTRTYLIKVIAYDSIGCESEPKLISVRTESCQRFFAPNSFTPNGDGLNDIFEIKGMSVYKPILKIFNRWGVVVYESSNLYWTGDSGTGFYCDNGIYNWIIDYRDKFGQNRQESGYVTLIR